MTTYKFSNGDVVTTKLPKDEMLKRMRRLDILRVMTEGFSEGDGADICRKSLRAYDKVEGFTGIIRLKRTEREFLSYMLESDMLSDEEIEVIRFYCGYTDKQWEEIISFNEHLANR